MIITLLFLFINVAIASDPDEDAGQKVVYKSKTEIDFEDLEVEGVLLKPQSALVLERKQASFNPLVKLRLDWNDEIDESIDDAK